MLNPIPSRQAPSENGDLIVHSRMPLNAEPHVSRLRAAFLTKQSDFYIRSHGSIPLLDDAAYRLRIKGRVTTRLELSLDDLRENFSVVTVTATMQCAGNRRADFQRVKPTAGDPWAPGAIGNAEWTGVSLADVLRGAGAEAGAHLHVAFTSADECEVDGKSFLYGASIPITKALSREVLLAWAINGEKLKAEHGAPLRVVVPGWAGVRSAKWITSITVQSRPSDSPIQSSDYKLYPSDVTAETADPAGGMTINAMPVNSAICEPAPHAMLPVGRTILRGYASASGRRVARVEVSGNGGRTWMQATLEGEPAGSNGDQTWSWTFWHAVMDLTPGEHELAVRAWDDAGQTQPALPDDTWNYKGYLSAAWHRVNVIVG